MDEEQLSKKGSIASIKGYKLAIISLVATLVLGILGIFGCPSKKNIILIEDVHGEILTKKKESTPKFRVEYFYDSLEINHLISYEIALTNLSDRTLIGKGHKSDLIYGKFTLPIDTTYKLIHLKQKGQQPIDSINFDFNTINLTFAQWKSNTEISLILFLEHQKGKNILPKAVLLVAVLVTMIQL